MLRTEWKNKEWKNVIVKANEELAQKKETARIAEVQKNLERQAREAEVQRKLETARETHRHKLKVLAAVVVAIFIVLLLVIILMRTLRA